MEILAVDTSFCKMIMEILVRNTPMTDPLFMTASNSGTYCSDVHVVLVVAEHSEASSRGGGSHNRKGRSDIYYILDHAPYFVRARYCSVLSVTSRAIFVARSRMY